MRFFLRHGHGLPAGAVLLLSLVPASGLTAAESDPVEALGENWRWRVFDRAEGLGSNTVTALHQDRNEYVYAATDRGVSRYDLWEWTVLENAKPFDDGEVRRFVESPSALYAVTANALWKVQGGTVLAPFYRGGGLFAASNDLGDVFVIESRDAKHLQVRGEAVERIDDVRLPGGRVVAYDVDPARVHWLLTTDGLFQRDTGRRAWRELHDRDIDTALSDRKCMRFFRVELPPGREGEQRERETAASGSRWELWGLFIDPRSASSPQSLARLENGTWMQTAVVEGPLLGQVLLDSRRNYLATAEDGRLSFSPDGRQWSRVPSLGIGKTALHGGLLDASGVLWFRNGAGGVAAFDPQSRTWEAIPSGLGESYPNVLSIVETEDGEAWMGMTRGVSRLPEGKMPETWQEVQDTALEKVTGIAEDGLHRLWVSSAESFNGAFYYDLDNDSWAREERDGFKDHPIRRIVRDRGGELWFLSKETNPTGGYTIYRSSLATSYELASVRVGHGPVNDLARTQDEVLWLATDDGLLEGTLEGESFHLKKRYTDRDGLLSIQVWAVTEGPDGAIWVCYPSSGAGVTRFKGGEARSYQESDGLASPEVWSITSSGQNLWFGTSRGLSRFDGECWYSYPVASLDVRSIRVLPVFASKREPEAILIGTFGQGALRFRLDDRRRPRFSSHDLPGRVPEGANVVLEWDARDYRNQTPHERLLYRSRLDGGSWTRFSNARARALEGLAPGRHSLEVEVRDLAGNRNREELVHRFVVGEVAARDLLRLAGIAASAVLLAAVASWLVATQLRSRRRSNLCRGLFREFPGPVFFLDAGGKLADWNDASPETAGLEGIRREDLIGRPLHVLPLFFADDVRAALKRLLGGEAVQVRGLRFPRDGVAGRVVDVKGFPLPRRGGAIDGAVVIVEDRTRAAEEDMLRERERRLSSLRSLAGCMAADFGGVLRAVLAEVASNSSPTLLERMRHAEAIARKLSAFAGGGQGEGAPLLTQVHGLVERLLGADGNGRAAKVQWACGVKLDFRGSPGLWSAAVEEPLLEDALVEVLRNAAEAMPERGTLTVRAQNLRVDGDPGRLAAGSYVEILVKDTGTGMDEVQMQRLFEPFHSTKPRDRALGIGLAIAYGIVRAHGGDIRVESRLGLGTEVRLIVPAARA